MTTDQRQINSDEERDLVKEINSVTKEIKAPLKWGWIFICLILTGLSVIHIYYYDESNWSVISKILVCVCPILIWCLLELRFKGKKQQRKFLNELQAIVNKGRIAVLRIIAKRVIKFEEKDDEGTLYLIEDVNGNSIYLWDDQYLIPEEVKFPRQNIEIYLDRPVVWALATKVICSGEEVEVLKISGDKKWTFFKNGFPEDLEKYNKPVDTIIAELV
jgi:hypothetical protein